MSYPPEIVLHGLWWFFIVVGLLTWAMWVARWTRKLLNWLHARARRREQHS